MAEKNQLAVKKYTIFLANNSCKDMLQQLQYSWACQMYKNLTRIIKDKGVQDMLKAKGWFYTYLGRFFTPTSWLIDHMNEGR